jgi:methyl halide transferase
MMTTPVSFNGSYWDNRYQQQQTGWDIGHAAPALVAYFSQLARRDLRILIPGCGNAYEAVWLLENGFTHITLLDIAPALVADLRERLAKWLPKGLEIITGDFFTHTSQYDLIMEQTFFCALDPALRSAYAQKAGELLAPGGKLVGLLFNREFDPLRSLETGPPFGGNAAEYRPLFAPFFTIQCMEPCYNSIKPRAGTELFIQLVKPA